MGRRSSHMRVVGRVNDSVIEGQLRHGVVFAVSRPESGLMLNGCCRDQSVRYFQAMTLAELAKKSAGKLADCVIQRDARKNLEKSRSYFLFVSARPSPHFRRDDGREQEDF